MKLTELLGEYFFGRETIRKLKQKENFYREFCPNELDMCKRLLDILKKERTIEEYIRKGANLIDIISIGSFIYTKQPLFLLCMGTSESLRFGWHYKIRKNPMIEKFNKKSEYLIEEMKRDEIEENEGEEWKDSYFE